tara:strand:- start:1506 stop:2360 length:855 start_codon:yes stop_codon:yes gene_type:complete
MNSTEPIDVLKLLNNMEEIWKSLDGQADSNNFKQYEALLDLNSDVRILDIFRLYQALDVPLDDVKARDGRSVRDYVHLLVPFTRSRDGVTEEGVACFYIILGIGYDCFCKFTVDRDGVSECVYKTFFTYQEYAYVVLMMARYFQFNGIEITDLAGNPLSACTQTHTMTSLYKLPKTSAYNTVITNDYDDIISFVVFCVNECSKRPMLPYMSDITSKTEEDVDMMLHESRVREIIKTMRQGPVSEGEVTYAIRGSFELQPMSDDELKLYLEEHIADLSRLVECDE